MTHNTNPECSYCTIKPLKRMVAETDISGTCPYCGAQYKIEKKFGGVPFPEFTA